MLAPLTKGEISFEKIEVIRTSMCPEATQYSAILNYREYGLTHAFGLKRTIEYKKAMLRPAKQCFRFIHPSSQLCVLNIRTRTMQLGILGSDSQFLRAQEISHLHYFRPKPGLGRSDRRSVLCAAGTGSAVGTRPILGCRRQCGSNHRLGHVDR